MSQLFASKWANTCPECGEGWDEGDQIGFVTGHPKPLCEECWTKAQRTFARWYEREPVLETAVENICNECQMIHKGECL